MERGRPKITQKPLYGSLNLSNALAAKPDHYDSPILVGRVVSNIAEIFIKRNDDTPFPAACARQLKVARTTQV